MRHLPRRPVKRWLTALLVAAAALTSAGPAGAATATLQVSVAVAPATAKIGSVVVVSGTLSSHEAAVPVVLQRLVAKRWTTVAHTRSTKGGRYAVRLRAPRKAATWALRITRAAAVSSTAHLRVVEKSFAVRASAPPSVAGGVPVVVTGSVAPRATGTVALSTAPASSATGPQSGRVPSPYR